MKADVLDRPDRETVPGAVPCAAPPQRCAGLRPRQSAPIKALLSIIDQAIVSGTSFATAVIIARSCAPDAVGVYYLMLSIVLILVGVQHNLVVAPYTLFYRRCRGRDKAEYTGSVWVQQLVLIGATALILCGLIATLSIAGAAEITPALWTLLGAGPLLLLREAIRRFSFARLQLVTAIGVDVTVSVFQLAGLLLLAYLGRLSVFSAFGMMAAACGMGCCGWFISKARTPRFVPRRFVTDWIQNWSLAKWGLLSYLLVDTLPYLMPWIVEFAAGTAATGVFGACATLVGVTNVLVIGTSNLLGPQAVQSFSAHGIRALRRVLMLVAGLFLSVFGALCLVVLLSGDRLAVLIYGAAFSGSGTILLALIGNVLVGSLGMVANHGLWALAKPRAAVPADICMLLITMLVALCLVFPYGALGAALASLIGTAIGTVLKVLALFRAMNSIRSEAAVT